MKRVLSLVLAFMLVFSSILPAFAEEATFSEDGQKLVDYKIIAGTGNGDDAEGQLTRAAMTVLLAAMYGEKEVAETYAFTPSFTDVAEGKWYTPYIAYAEQKGWMSGDAAGGTFRPDDAMKAQEVNAMFLKALGYDVEWTAVNEKAEELEIAVDAADPTLVLRGEAFATILEVLDTPKMDETDTLGTALAIPNYSEPTPEAPETVAVSAARAVNSVVVEVELDSDLDAPTAITVDQFVVTDEDDAAVEVEKVEFAPWDADNYTVLVTVEGFEAGNLYTVTSGETAVNFGGIDADEDEPTVVDITSDDYNKVTIEFSEAVLIDDLTIELAEKYGDKDELAVVDWAYDGSDKVVVTTSEQAASTLYTSTIDGATDVAGNAMEEDDSQTFTGTAMDDSEQSVKNATADDFKTVTVQFNVNVDEATALDASNYTITEKYGDKKEIAIASVEMALDSDDEVIEDSVELTLADGLEGATLYELEVENVGTLYGEDYDSDADPVSFTGVEEDTDEPSGIVVTAVSNTQIKVTLTDDSDAADEYDLSLFAVTEKYGDNDELALIAIDDIDGKDIYIDTEEQSAATLYEMEVAEGLADKWGNVTDDELTDTFTGMGVADEISSITLNHNSDGVTLRVTFDQNYGDGALDVANYFIDGGIGYPTKVEEVSGSDVAVDLTIKETATGKLYEIEVNNIFNADDVEMDEDGLTATFVGKGDTTADPRLEAAVATDEQTIKLYFDTDVDDVAGVEDIANYTITGGGAALDLTNALFVKDVNTDLVMVLTLDKTTDGDVVDLAGADSDDLYTIVVANSDLDTDYDEIEVAANDDEVTEIAIEGIVASDASNVTVYFNQTVRTVVDGAITVDHDNDALTADVDFENGYAANDEGTQWVFAIATALDSTEELDVTVATPANITIGASSTGDVAYDADEVALTMAGNTDAADVISDVAVVMTNEKQMIVYFPEDMDSDDAETLAFYNLDPTGLDLTPVAASYDSDDYTVTLEFDTAVGTGTFDLEITNSVIYNRALTNYVNDADAAATDLAIEFAGSDADADLVLIDDVSIDGQVITIELNQAATAGSNFVDDGTELLKYFDITVNGSTALSGAAITTVKTFEADGTTPVVTSTADFSVIEVTVDAGLALTVNESGEIAFDAIDAAADTLTGINAEVQDDDQDAIVFVQE